MNSISGINQQPVSAHRQEQSRSQLTTSHLKLLTISFAYPPAASPRAVQVGRLLKYLPVSTTLLCAEYDEKDRIDPALVKEVDVPHVRCVRVPFTRTRFESLLARAAYKFELPIVNKTPDQFGPWKPKVLAAVEELVRSESYVPNLLATFGSPMSDHLIGMKLKRRFNIPWIAHFSDPWADNPFLGYGPFTKRLNRALESRVLREADRLVFTSAETVDLVVSNHGESLRAKMRVLPHAFDKNLFQKAPPVSETATVIRYLGDFYGRRTPKPLFAALKHMLELEPAVLEGVRFELIGSHGEGQLEEAGIRNLPDGLVTVRKPVSYQESLQLMSSADGLLVIDAPAAVSVFLPSKLIDYVGSARPVLGITPEGTAASLIRRLGGWVADPTDLQAVTQTLTTFIAFLRANDSGIPWGDKEIRRGFEALAVAQTFADILLDAQK